MLSKEVNEMNVSSRVMGEGFVEPDVDSTGVDLRTGSGILVLSTEAGLLYTNKKGSELLTK